MALHNASIFGHTDVVEILLNHNADINVVTKVIQIMRMSVFYCNHKLFKKIVSRLVPYYALIDQSDCSISGNLYTSERGV